MKFTVTRGSIKLLKRYSDHLKALNEDDRNTRFGYNATDYNIDQLMLKIVYDYDHHHFFIATDGDNIFGWGHLAYNTKDSLELAVSVDSKYRGNGIADALVKEMIRWSKLMKISTVYMHCIESNKAIQHIAKKHNLTLKERVYGEITSALHLDPPTPVEIGYHKFDNILNMLDEMIKLHRRTYNILLDKHTLQEKSHE